MMKKWAALLLCVLMMAAASAAPAETVMPEMETGTITVQGSASVSAKPDIVTISANASVMGTSMLDAQDKLSGVIAETAQKLLELGVVESDIVTIDYSYYPEYDYEDSGRRLTGYQACHTLEITCRDIGMLDSVITAVTDGGMSEIYNISYGLSSRSEMYTQALALAVQAAESKALTLAAASGQTILGIESVAENESYDARYAVSMASADGMAEEAAAELSPGIRSGSVSVSAGVTVVYKSGK